MAPDDVDKVLRLFAYWEHGDWAASAELFHPRFESVFSARAFPDPGAYQGARATLEAWRSWLEAWDEFGLELERTIPADETIVALLTLRGRGKSSGIAIESEVGSIFDFSDGKITRMVFCDREEALAAVGRRPAP
jgi:ketosteroid isomerase-like protein